MKIPTSPESLWIHTGVTGVPHAPLMGEVVADVAIIGAGITGLTAALHLARAGKSVVVLEARTVASGVSGYTSAHLTEMLDTRYKDIVSDFGEEKARLVAASSRAAIDEIERVAREENIGCQFRRVPGYLYTEGADVTELEAELAAAKLAGVAASMTQAVPLPFARAAITVPNQAQFHPREYLLGLADRVAALGVRIFEHSPVTEVTEEEPHVLTTEEGRVRAEVVVYATHSPLSRFVLQTKLARYQSYVMAFAPRGPVLPGLFWDTADPYHYTRTLEVGDATLLIVGGEDHKTGKKTDTNECYVSLAAYIDARYGSPSIHSKWSSQVIETVDGLPYIGQEPGSRNAYVSTGYSGNGLTFGTLGGMIVSDAILGRPDPYAELYAPSRIKPLAAAKDFIVENVDVPVHMVAGAIRLARAPSAESVSAGEADVIRHEGKLVALYRDETGCPHAVSAVCPHMGCAVEWNGAEKTWDCPCHGSRFDLEGALIAGPSKTGLAPVYGVDGEADPDGALVPVVDLEPTS